MLELVTNPQEVAEGGEPEFKKYWTPPFITYAKTREAVSLAAKMDKEGNDTEKIGGIFDELENFVVELYDNKFTLDELRNGLHGPDALMTLSTQLRFVSDGVQSEGTQTFLKEKKN